MELDSATLILTIVYLATGQNDEAKALAELAKELPDTTRKAHLVHLRRYQKAPSPDLTEDQSNTLRAVVAAYEGHAHTNARSGVHGPVDRHPVCT